MLRRRFNYVAILGALIVALGISQAVLAAPPQDGVNGTTLSAYKTAIGHWTRTFTWTIDKSVTPATLDMFTGDSGSVDYTVAVTKDGGTDAVWVDGQICVTNGGAVATENLTIVDNLQAKSGGGAFQTIQSVPVDTSANPVLDPGESYCYNYSIAFTPVAGAQYKNNVDITITNHSGHLDTPFGPSPSADFSVPASPTLINDSINVDDTNGSSWPFSGSGSQTYSKTFTCDADGGQHDNTATIRETGQSDSASVQVNCYALQVNKDAATSLTRTWTWTINKTADQSALTLAPGESYLVNYTVSVGASSADSNWAATGNISVYNPAPMAASLVGVFDDVAGIGAATVTCPGATFPGYSLAAGATLNCTYSVSLPNADTRLNTATAVLQNTPSGTTNFTGSAEINFGSPSVAEIDECVAVNDTFAGSLGTVCANELPKTYTYSRTITAPEACGDYNVDNTASFVTNDTGTTNSSGYTVVVHVPCAGGCTLTIGYWKTHSIHGPAQADAAWGSLADATFFLSGQTYYQVLWTPPSGNAYYNLAHQYIAAYLNGLNGANTSVVSAQMSQALTLLQTYSPAQVDALKGSAKNTWTSLGAALEAFNSGVTGPGHCSE